MTYVRTEDGVITYEKYIDLIACGSKTVRMLNKSDTIEELCDTIIHIKGRKVMSNLPLTFNYYGQTKIFVQTISSINDNDNIRLGIWTNKGLKYVAKMENGEVVLI